jgi:beta-glucosidase
VLAVAAVLALAAVAQSQEMRPGPEARKDPETRANLLLRSMTDDEKFALLAGFFATSHTPRDAADQMPPYTPPPEARPASAGYFPGIPRLGVPAQWETDGGIGVSSQGGGGTVRERTALPSGIATAATWDPALAYQAGAMIGAEARASGFNVMLAGGINLAREPRNGRNFEYGGEDPLLAGTMVGAQIRGIQSNHVIATLKHLALNDQETGRKSIDIHIADDQARMSDLLAFEIALDIGHPGAVMCAYNRVNGIYACENRLLMQQFLKRDLHYPGYVMSDWGAVHSTVESALAGLDQESAALPFDAQVYFGAPLRTAVQAGRVPQARIDDIVRRILRSMMANGLFEYPIVTAPIDFKADGDVSQHDAEESMVLLRNENHVLPLSPDTRRIAVIGAHADVGVLSGGGSAQVYPVGGPALNGLGPQTFPGPIVYQPSSPLAAVRARRAGGDVRFAGGEDVAAAARLAADSDVVLLFADQWSTEERDRTLELPAEQETLIEAVLQANPRTVVVLETSGAVLMPWLDRCAAVLEAWYPGTRGGEAIARVLFGESEPAGRLPVTWPRSAAQLPRPVLDGTDLAPTTPFEVTYREGAAVGYKWFDRQRLEPLFAFGYGLSYGRTRYAKFTAGMRHEQLRVAFDVVNVADRAVSDVAQVYVGSLSPHWEAPKRLAGWRKVRLGAGETTHVVLDIDPRILAVWHADRGWTLAPGDYSVMLGASSADLSAQVSVRIPAGVRLRKPWHLAAAIPASGDRAGETP